MFCVHHVNFISQNNKLGEVVPKLTDTVMFPDEFDRFFTPSILQSRLLWDYQRQLLFIHTTPNDSEILFILFQISFIFLKNKNSFFRKFLHNSRVINGVQATENDWPFIVR
jgi:hypothetical protein